MSEQSGDKRPYVQDAVQMLRTVQGVQYQLSQMADQKANMLLGVTCLIFTITVAQVRAGERDLPLLILGGAAFVSAALAVLAVLPSVKSPPAPAEGGNLLFFGSFTQMTEDEYVATMMELTEEPRAIHASLIRDIYQNGRVLSRKKYKLLGYAYRMLLGGLVASLIAAVTLYAMKLL